MKSGVGWGDAGRRDAIVRDQNFDDTANEQANQSTRQQSEEPLHSVAFCNRTSKKTLLRILRSKVEDDLDRAGAANAV